MSWPTAALSEVAKIERSSIAPTEIVSGSRYVGLEHIESGGASISFGEVANGELASNKFRFGPQHILFGKLRPYLAKIACPDFAGICSTDILPIAPGKRIDQRYLLRYLQRPETVGWASARATGVNLPRLSPNELASLEVPLPPLDEQRRIAAILDKADALRRNRRRSLELLDVLRRSIFLERFGSEHAAARQPLADIVDRSDRINYGVVQPGEHDEDGVFLVRVSDLSGGAVDHSALRKVSHSVSDAHRRSVLKGNEVLISCVGSIGEISVATERERGFNVARAIARVPITDPLLRIYVAEYLKSPRVRRYFTKELRTVSQPTLNIKQIAETEIAVPEREELIEFSQAAASVQKSREIATKLSEQADHLFFSLQHRAFTGQL